MSDNGTTANKNETETWKAVSLNVTSITYQGGWKFSTSQSSFSGDSTGANITGKINSTAGSTGSKGDADNSSSSPSTYGDESRESSSLFSLTNDPNASVFLSFTGSKIQVHGIILPGNTSTRASYTVDKGKSVTRTVPGLSQDSPLDHQTLFESTDLNEGSHNITVDEIVTDGDRMFALSAFSVRISSQTLSMQSHKVAPHNGKGLIAGATLGALAFLAILSLCTSYIWRRRKLQQVYPISSWTNVTSLHTSQDPRLFIVHSDPEDLNQLESWARISNKEKTRTNPRAEQSVLDTRLDIDDTQSVSMDAHDGSASATFDSRTLIATPRTTHSLSGRGSSRHDNIVNKYTEIRSAFLNAQR